MTELGLCHNANSPDTRLTAEKVRRYRPRHARTITYWRDDGSAWRETLGACRELADLGVRNLIVFNTEAYGGRLVDIDLMTGRLHAFLAMARDEFGGPVHGIEPLNEIDAPGWIFGTVEQGIDELAGYIGAMQLDLTEGGCWTIRDALGEEARRRFVEAVCAFQHDRVRRNYYFALNDGCCSGGDLDEGKDFGIEDGQGRPKLAAASFDGGLPL